VSLNDCRAKWFLGAFSNKWTFGYNGVDSNARLTSPLEFAGDFEIEVHVYIDSLYDWWTILNNTQAGNTSEIWADAGGRYGFRAENPYFFTPANTATTGLSVLNFKRTGSVGYTSVDGVLKASGNLGTATTRYDVFGGGFNNTFATGQITKVIATDLVDSSNSISVNNIIASATKPTNFNIYNELDGTVIGQYYNGEYELVKAILPVTDGMTLTEAWQSDVEYLTLYDAESSSCRVDAIISNTDSGILMESGGVQKGLVLYVFEGILYFQCGGGDNFGTASDTAETSYTLPVGEFNYTIEWSSNSSNAVLYVNSVNVDSQTFNNSAITGTNVGKRGSVADAVPVNRGGWVSAGSGNYTNTITKCDIFLNQVTSDV